MDDHDAWVDSASHDVLVSMTRRSEPMWELAPYRQSRLAALPGLPFCLLYNICEFFVWAIDTLKI